MEEGNDPMSSEDGHKLLKLAKRVLDIFKRYPEQCETFSNVFEKATEIINFGETEVSQLALTYCIELSIFLLAFALPYDNYKRVEISVRHLRHSEEILRRLHDLYETKIHPMLVEIDNQLKIEGEQVPPAKRRDVLELKMQEIREILREMEKVVTDIDIELVRQRRKNELTVAGCIGLSMTGAAFSTTTTGLFLPALAVGATIASLLGYTYRGNDNVDMLKEALEKLNESKKSTNDDEKELLTYMTRLEMVTMF